MNRPTKIIGLTVGVKSLLLAEVQAGARGERGTIGQLAEFPYPEGLSLSTPAELGAALGAFLKGQKFTTREVIIGLPARRLLTRRKEVPPASESVAAATLRLQAEAEFAPAGNEADPFAIDFAGQTSSKETSAVLLVATAQSGIEQCSTLAKAAGLRLRGVTASAAALGRATATLPDGDGLILSLAGGGAELVVQHGQNSTQLRHLAITNAGTPESIAALAGEIRRTIASLHQNGTPLTLALWDDAAGDSGDAGSLLGQRLGLPVSSPNVRSLASSNHGEMNLNAYAPAVAVALSALDAAGPPVDFLHSRLTPPKQHTNKRPILLGAIAGGVVVLAIVAGFVDLHLKQSTLDALNAQHASHAKEIAVAQTGYDRLRDARKWTVRKPRYTACLRDLTKLFPDPGNTIWATAFSLTPDNKGTLSGKAVSEAQVSELRDRMLASKEFLNAVITENRKNSPTVRGGASEQSFTISFTYKAPE